MPTCRLATHRLADHLALACRLADLLPTCRLVTHCISYAVHCISIHQCSTPFIAYFSHILARTALSDSLLAPPTHQSLVSVPPTHQSLVSVHRHINPWCRFHRYINPWCRLHRHISPWCRFHRHINPWRRFGRRDRRFTDETWTGNRLSKVGRRRCTILMRMADRIRPATSSISIPRPSSISIP